MALNININRLKQNSVSSCLHRFAVVGSGGTDVTVHLNPERVPPLRTSCLIANYSRVENFPETTSPCAKYVVWMRRGQSMFKASATFGMCGTSSDKNTRYFLPATNYENNHSPDEKHKRICCLKHYRHQKFPVHQFKEQTQICPKVQ